MQHNPQQTPIKPGAEISSPPGFFRRMAALIYDALLLLALLFLATALLLPFNDGEAFSSHQIYYPFYLISVSYCFYGWFWTHGGQTLGLRAWKIRVKTLDLEPINWKQALIRFSTAMLSWLICGLGFLWIIFDRKKLAWHDHLSQTALFFDDQPRKPT